jgi:WD40 repeat protein
MHAESYDDLPKDEELTGMLKDVVQQVRAVPAPPEVVARLVERAAGWSNPETAARAGAHPRRAHRRIYWWAWPAVAALVFLAVAILTKDHWLTGPVPVISEPVAEAPAPTPKSRGAMSGRSVASPNKSSVKEVPPLAAGGSLGGSTSGRGAGGLASRYLAVAADAPVLVSTGGKKPIPLGDRQPYSAESTLHVWDWSKGKESRPLDAASPSGMAVSPDGKWIVTRTGQVIDVATGASRQLDNIRGQPRGLRFTPDGKALLLLSLQGSADPPRPGESATARLLDFPSGKKRCDIDGLWPFTFACGFTPDGSQVCLMDKDKVLRRWDTQTGKELGHYEPAFENSIRAIVVSPDGKRVAAAGTRGDLYLWELAGGKLLHKLTATQMPDLTVLTGLDSLAFSPDGQWLAGGSFMRLVLWETDSGKVAQVFPNGSGGAFHVRFARDGKQITTVTEFFGTRGNAGEDLLIYPQVRHWDVDGGKEIK